MYLAARGSSDNAATFAKYLFESRARVAAALAAPSLFTLYRTPPDLSGAAVIGISQSGAAPDVAEVLARGRRDGASTVAVTNAARSAVARAAEHVVLLGTGPERSVAATKTYTATCLALGRLAGAPLQGVADAFQAALDARAACEALARKFAGATPVTVLGRGYTYPSAMEIALKVKELAGLEASAYSAADFAHGPIALATRGARVLLVAARGPTLAGMRSLARMLRERGARVVALTDDPGLARACDGSVLLDADVDEEVAALALVVCGQLLARALAIGRGRDPDRPRGLRKVTRTR